MPGQRLEGVLRQMAGAAGRFATNADGDLLQRFLADRDEAAFAELVRRHSAMVLGVCRRALGNTPDAEDACQATFLVLARKATAIRRTDAVGGWLYGVARRVAQRVRTASRRGLPLMEQAGPDTTADVTWRDGLRVLDEELTRLPEAYRSPLVLCYLEGKTQDEAARQLGWTLGTFRGRLERGRARLRDRLNRRGVGLAVLAAVAAVPGGTNAALPMTIRFAILKTALAATTGETVLAVPATVVALAEGVIQAMTVTKLQWTAGAIAVCGMLTFGGVWATGQGPGVGPGPQPPGAGRPAIGAPAGTPDAAPPAEPKAGASQRRRSQNNLKQIMLAIHNYHDTYGHLPADIRDKDGKALLSWRVAILPFLEQDNLFKQYKVTEPWDSEHNLKLLQNIPPVYLAGIEAKGATHTYYQAFAGPGTPLHPTVIKPVGRPGAPMPGPPGVGFKDETPGASAGGPGAGTQPFAWPAGPRISMANITDGTSNTLGVIEAGPPVPWSKPADIPFDPTKRMTKLVGPFSNALHFGMMDGSVHAIKRELPDDVWRKLIVMNDGFPLPDLGDYRPAAPTETPEERAQLAQVIAQNEKVIGEISVLLKEHVQLLSLRNQMTRDGAKAEDTSYRLREIVEELRLKNKQIRDDLGLRPGAPIPAVPPRGR